MQVRQSLEEDGRGRVLVVDGGGSMRCALLGDNIAEMAYKNGWSVSTAPPLLLCLCCFRSVDRLSGRLFCCKRRIGCAHLPENTYGMLLPLGTWV